MKRWVVACLCVGWMGVVGAQEALGPVYPIAEPDLLEILKRHAREEADELNRRARESRQTLQRYAERPIGGPNRPTALAVRQWSYAAPKIEGEMVSLLPDDFQRQWLFINADSPKQVRLAQRFMKGKTVATHRVILVKGSVKETQKALKERVWFDQGGVLVKRFAIQAVPCLMKATQSQIHFKEMPE